MHLTNVLSVRTPQAPAAAPVVSTGSLQRTRWNPCTSKENEATIMLTEFVCQDESFMSALGSHSKAFTWIVEGGRKNPVNISLQVEKKMMGKAEILVKEDDRKLFPSGNSDAKASLPEDFVQRWNFCGRAAGLHEEYFYEVEFPATDDHAENEDAPPQQSAWYPATLTRQLEDGLFEVLACVPDGRGGFNEVVRNAVNSTELRERHTHKRIHVPWRYVKLTIPKSNPLEATFRSDKDESILQFLAMPTPPAVGLDAEVASTLTLRVDRGRSFVESDVSVAAFDHFMTGEVRRGDTQAERWRKDWALQLGPFAEHSMTIEKGEHAGVLRLSVDGKRLVEASAQELNCSDGTWRCRFRFIGQRFLEFVVFETNNNGVSLSSQGTVLQESSVEHTCSLEVQSLLDLSTAMLQIDGRDFMQLPPKVSTPGGGHKAPLDSLRQVYGLHVPYKTNDSYTGKASTTFLDHLEPLTAAVSAGKSADTESSLASWFVDLKSIWHACTTPTRVPSEDGVPTPDYERRPPAVPQSPPYYMKATW